MSKTRNLIKTLVKLLILGFLIEQVFLSNPNAFAITSDIGAVAIIKCNGDKDKRTIKIKEDYKEHYKRRLYDKCGDCRIIFKDLLTEEVIECGFEILN